MTRPDNITEEDIREWEEDRLDHLKDEERNGGAIVPVPAEVWYAGCWLYRELESLGCNEELRTTIGEATGQRQAYSDNHWQTAQTALENYKKGVWESPGPELAMKLVHEKYGNPPDAQRMLSDLIKAGADPEKLMMLAAAREMENIVVKKKRPKPE